MTMNLPWVTRNTTGNWISLELVDLSKVSAFGVYVIWHGGDKPRVVRVGQGDIADRLSAHRKDRLVLSYASHGPLRVTWAAVPAQLVDGVERYLAEHWKPLIGDRFPNALPVAVNSPFGS